MENAACSAEPSATEALNAALIKAVVHQTDADGLREIRRLLRCGADANAKNMHGHAHAALSIAAWKQTGATGPKVIRALLKKGASVNANCGGVTALMAAALYQTEETGLKVIRMLLKAGADPNCTHPVNGATPLIAACRCYRKKTGPAVIHALLKAGANVNATDKDGSTPLMYAAKFQPGVCTDAPEMLRILVGAMHKHKKQRRLRRAQQKSGTKEETKDILSSSEGPLAPHPPINNEE